MRRRIVWVCLGAAIVAATLFALDFFETPGEHYPNYGAAIRDGAVQRGWIPSFVPTSAKDIDEMHNLDTNCQWIAFKAPVEDLRVMIGAMKPISHSEARETGARKPYRFRRWPFELSEPLLATPRASILYYQAPAMRVAVDWSSGEVFAWSC